MAEPRTMGRDHRFSPRAARRAYIDGSRAYLHEFHASAEGQDDFDAAFSDDFLI